MRVFSTLMQTRTRVAWELRSERFVWGFSQLSCLDQTRIRVAWELSSELFVWEFSKLSCLDQTRTRVAWELRSESLHESFLNFHASVKQEQELHESWEASGLHEGFLNPHASIGQTRTRVAWELRSERFAWEFSQLSCLDRSNENKSWRELTRCYRAWRKLSSIFEPVQSWRECMSVSCNTHPSRFDWYFTSGVTLLFWPLALRASWTWKLVALNKIHLPSDNGHWGT
jgi:hypothetical protein